MLHLLNGFQRDEERAQGEDISSSGNALSHNAYRATIMKQALKMANGKEPNTKQLYDAKKKVDGFLGKAGVGISIPGARPRRTTV